MQCYIVMSVFLTVLVAETVPVIVAETVHIIETGVTNRVLPSSVLPMRRVVFGPLIQGETSYHTQALGALDPAGVWFMSWKQVAYVIG
jgi:hypothetical protein